MPAFWLRAVILLAPLVLLNMFSVGTVMNAGLAGDRKDAADRCDLHRPRRHLDLRGPGAAGAAADRLRLFGVLGRQFDPNLPQGMEWAEFASHSHNGYLDTALTMGLPGLALLIAVLVIAPLRDFHAADRGGNGGPLAMLLLQIWLFALYLSSMESFFLDRVDPMWFTFLIAVFGPALPGAIPGEGLTLKLRSCTRLRARLCHQPSKSNGACADGQLQRRYNAVGIGVVAGSARDQHDGAAVDQFLEARMMVELVRLRPGR